MAVNNLGTTARAKKQIRTQVLNTTSATKYDSGIVAPPAGYRNVILGIAVQGNVANLVVTMESENGDDMLVFQCGVNNGLQLWIDAGICSSNAAEKVTLTHSTSALLTGVIHYIVEEGA